jgi:hypothetical protein
MSITDKLESAVAIDRRDAKRRARQLRLLLAILSGATAASLLILKFAPVPFFWLWLTWAAFLFAAILIVHGSWPRAILFNFGIVLCLLAAGEAYLSTNEYTSPIFLDGDFYVHDDVLGWAPNKGIEAHAIKLGPAGLLNHPAGLLFDTRYTIDSNGLRIAPPYRRDDLAGTVLFFGCSFTFGEGLKDNETLPYQVGAQSGGRYRTFNFGFEGYSPAQMLAEVEHGIVRRVVDTTPRYAYYVAIPGHVWRVAGLVSWGGHAPRYVLDADGTVHQEGYFEDRRPLAERLGFGRRAAGQLNKSAVWRLLSMGESRITDDDVRLYFAMVRRSQELLATQYPGIQFRIILWPNQDVPQERAVYEKMRDEFRRLEIPVDLVEDILPDYNRNRERFQISSADEHPSALANRLIAQYLLNQIAK